MVLNYTLVGCPWGFLLCLAIYFSVSLDGTVSNYLIRGPSNSSTFRFHLNWSSFVIIDESLMYCDRIGSWLWNAKFYYYLKVKELRIKFTQILLKSKVSRCFRCLQGNLLTLAKRKNANQSRIQTLNQTFRLLVWNELWKTFANSFHSVKFSRVLFQRKMLISSVVWWIVCLLKKGNGMDGKPANTAVYSRSSPLCQDREIFRLARGEEKRLYSQAYRNGMVAQDREIDS